MTSDAYDSTPARGTGPVWTRVYRPYARHAHLRQDVGLGSVACDPLDRRWPDDDEWRGTGSQEEYDRAAVLPLCTACFAIREAARLGIDFDQTDPAERERTLP